MVQLKLHYIHYKLLIKKIIIKNKNLSLPNSVGSFSPLILITHCGVTEQKKTKNLDLCCQLQLKYVFSFACLLVSPSLIHMEIHSQISSKVLRRKHVQILMESIKLTRSLCRFLMVNLITEDVICTVLAYAYGKFIAVICLTLILASLMCHLLLCDRSIHLENSYMSPTKFCLFFACFLFFIYKLLLNEVFDNFVGSVQLVSFKG